MNKRQCKQCLGWYDPVFFESGGSYSVGVHTYRKSRGICKGCSQTNRDGKKALNRWRSKMNSTRKAHAQKFGITEADFESIYKWSLDQMEHDARHAYENGCPNCSRNFVSMGHGLADITLDIMDRDAPPVYGHNTRWICGTCNRQKGKYTLKEYSTLMMEWQRWNQQNHNPMANTLFDGQAVDFGKKAQMEYRPRGSA